MAHDHSPGGEAPRLDHTARRDRERSEEARQVLEGVSRDGQVLGASSLARAAEHFSGRDAPAGDPIELWGRRIGRALSLVFALYLITWLVDWFSR